MNLCTGMAMLAVALALLPVQNTMLSAMFVKRS
jgi:hypothetical protein